MLSLDLIEKLCEIENARRSSPCPRSNFSLTNSDAISRFLAIPNDVWAGAHRRRVGPFDSMDNKLFVIFHNLLFRCLEFKRDAPAIIRPFVGLSSASVSAHS